MTSPLEDLAGYYLGISDEAYEAFAANRNQLFSIVALSSDEWLEAFDDHTDRLGQCTGGLLPH
jgi:hypothetical protein